VTDLAERLLNLAMFLARNPQGVTAEDCRDQVDGYGGEAAQNDAAFKRMLERDKETLRSSGLVIESRPEGTTTRYILDAGATYAAPLDLSADEVTVLGLAGAALADDPSFPFGADLHLALAKLAAQTTEGRVANPGRMADEAPETQGRVAATLADAVTRRKTARFTYTKADGTSRERLVDPYGIYSTEGRWYLVAFDREAEGERVFALARLADLAVNQKQPATPDFERPEGFDVTAWAMLPFQIGSSEHAFEAVLRFAPDSAWRARRLSAGRGSMTAAPDGSAVWTVTARDSVALQRWVVENGPGIVLVEPTAACQHLAHRLAEVARAHG
jgi:predicted DNA-binding transcriptional regulator YafY